jgi:hypothetical protein
VGTADFAGSCVEFRVWHGTALAFSSKDSYKQHIPSTRKLSGAKLQTACQRPARLVSSVNSV